MGLLAGVGRHVSTVLDVGDPLFDGVGHQALDG
jgi:hypothetical protein